MEALDVDEVIAQLLATEGFETVQEVAYVDAGEIAHIEGFDEDTAKEIQTRARDFLERQEAERDAKRKELGVSDDLAKIARRDDGHAGRLRRERHQDAGGPGRLPRPTTCAAGPSARRRRTPSRSATRACSRASRSSRKDVEDMIMAARIAAGWVTQEDLDKMRAEQAAAAAAAEAAKAAQAGARRPRPRS